MANDHTEIRGPLLRAALERSPANASIGGHQPLLKLISPLKRDPGRDAVARREQGGLMADQVHEISHQLGMLKSAVQTLTAEVHKLRTTAHEHNQALMVAYQTGDQVRAMNLRIAALEKEQAERVARRREIIAFAFGASLFGGGVGSAIGPRLWQAVRPWLMQ